MKANITDKGKSGIYCIRNRINQKVYIGKALCIHRRIKAHISNLNRKVLRQENDYFINAWHKYGRESFEYFVLEYCHGENMIKERELYWMEIYNCTDIDKGYNLRMDTSTNIIVNSKTRTKLSEATRKRFEDPREREKISKASTKRWKENPELKIQMAVAVKKAKQQKYKYLQYTREMELIHEWSTVDDIIAENPDYKWQNIYSVCNGYKKTIYGYIWKKELKI